MRRGKYLAAGSSTVAMAFGIYLAIVTGPAFLAPLLTSTAPVMRPAGTVVTTTRATTAYDIDAAGLLYSAAANAGRYHSVKGLLSTAATTNSLLHRRDHSNAAWVKTNVTATGGSDISGASGALFTRLTATAANATILQTLALAAASRTTSVYVRRSSGAGNIDITRDNGTTWTTLTSTQCGDIVTGAATAPNSSTWVRCSLTSSVLNPVIGVRIVTSGNGVDLDFWQDESGAIATPPCDISGVPGSAATCAADVHTVPTTGWPTGSGEISVVYTPGSGTAPVAANPLMDSRTTSTTQGLALFRDTSNRITFQMFAAAQTCSATSSALTWTAGTAKKIEAQWTPTTCEVFADNVSVATGVASGSPASHAAASYLGRNFAGSAWLDGWESTLCVGAPGRCP